MDSCPRELIVTAQAHGVLVSIVAQQEAETGDEKELRGVHGKQTTEGKARKIEEMLRNSTQCGLRNPMMNRRK